MLIIYYFQRIHNYNFWRNDYFFFFVQVDKKSSVFPGITPEIRTIFSHIADFVFVSQTKNWFLYAICVP